MPRPSGLRIEGARQNNLKNLSLEIPHDRLTVVTGVSGSGKSSLAFDTLFAEGQWRYIESLSTYARMFLDRVDRPDVDRIEHIRPAVALEQKNPVRTARSTVGTATEVYDYLRLLFAKIGRVHCPQCGAEAASHSPESIADTLLAEHAGARALITFPLPVPAGQPAGDLWAGLTRRGFARVLVDGVSCDLSAPPPDPLGSTLAVVLDRLVLGAANRARLVESLESALREGSGQVAVELVDGGRRVFAEAFRCSGCGAALERPQPLLFSFNHPLGACAECKGFGNILKYDEALLVPDRSRTLADGAVEPWTHPSGKWYQRELLKAAKRSGVDVTRPWETLEETHRAFVYEGDGKFPGINGFFEEIESYRYKLHVRVFLSRYRSQSPCPVCRGARLKAPALAVRVAGLTIAEFTALTIEEATAVLRELKLTVWEAAVGARSCASSRPSSRSCCGSASAISRSAARPGRCRAARPSASTWPTSSAPSSSARCTCSTSRPSACTRATPCGWPISAASWPRPATPWSSSSTTAASSRRRTTWWSWARARASAAARSCSPGSRRISASPRAR